MRIRLEHPQVRWRSRDTDLKSSGDGRPSNILSLVSPDFVVNFAYKGAIRYLERDPHFQLGEDAGKTKWYI